MSSLLILTPSPPGERGVGQNYIRDLIPVVPFDKIECCALLQSEDDWDLCSRQSVAGYQTLNRNFESAWKYGPPGARHAASCLAFFGKTVMLARRHASSVTDYCRQHQIVDVMTVLSSPLSILAAARLASQKNIRVHGLVWDHPDHVIRGFGHTGVPFRSLRSAFNAAVSKSKSLLTVSSSLKRLLAELNPSARCTVVPSPVEIRDAVSEGKHPDSPFVIGFAGSVTAPDELQGLQDALASIDWKIGNRRIVLRLFGSRFPLSARSSRFVEYRGFLETSNDVIQELSQCDVCFLPQGFKPSFELVSNYSFPTKLSTYLSSGRPVIAHAPASGTLARLGTDVPPDGISEFGVISAVPESISLLPLIERLSQDRKFYQSAQTRAREFALRAFSPEGTRAALADHFRSASPTNRDG
ncbi:hypothetical protein FHS27_002090 [Rhodopirellula rubra]|uniref:Glycosyltransferase n=1 Tax=Aporhodopirellula rubra TaxID=980271 RepID=A0A7W5DXD6_9BACT|nr:hypothetical protein [Aporhodopirellula rubra]MBB3206281.1 hypothetical protein [Aporhodopirellula rubra]